MSSRNSVLVLRNCFLAEAHGKVSYSLSSSVVRSIVRVLPKSIKKYRSRSRFHPMLFPMTPSSFTAVCRCRPFKRWIIAPKSTPLCPAANLPRWVFEQKKNTKQTNKNTKKIQTKTQKKTVLTIWSERHVTVELGPSLLLYGTKKRLIVITPSPWRKSANEIFLVLFYRGENTEKSNFD